MYARVVASAWCFRAERSSSETDEEASAIARWLTYRRSIEEEERRTSARPIVESAFVEEQAIESHV